MIKYKLKSQRQQKKNEGSKYLQIFILDYS
jgi:hypothetical protein